MYSQVLMKCRLIHRTAYTKRDVGGTVGRKSHEPCFHVFLMEARVTTFVAHCTVARKAYLI